MHTLTVWSKAKTTFFKLLKQLGQTIHVSKYAELSHKSTKTNTGINSSKYSILQCKWMNWYNDTRNSFWWILLWRLNPKTNGVVCRTWKTFYTGTYLQHFNKIFKASHLLLHHCISICVDGVTAILCHRVNTASHHRRLASSGMLL